MERLDKLHVWITFHSSSSIHCSLKEKAEEGRVIVDLSSTFLFRIRKIYTIRAPKEKMHDPIAYIYIYMFTLRS